MQSSRTPPPLSRPLLSHNPAGLTKPPPGSQGTCTNTLVTTRIESNDAASFATTSGVLRPEPASAYPPPPILPELSSHMDGNPDQSGRIRNPVYIDLTSPPPSPRLAFPRISPFSIGGSAERPIDVDLPSTTPTPPPPIAERLLDVDLPSSTSAPPLTSTQPPVISTSSGSVESSITNPIPATAAVIDSQYPTSVALVSETMRSDSRRSASRVSNATSTTRGGNSPSPSVARAASASKSRRPHLVREAKVGSIANMLQNYITDMKRDQVYIVKNCLAAARHVMNKVPVYRGAESPGRPGILYDEVSPFKDMEALDVSQPTGPDTIRLTAVHYPKTHTSSQHKLFLTPKFAETPKHLPEIPKYRHYITLRANLVAENEENLRYYPYFGEEDAESEAARQLRLEELFIDQTKKSSEVNQRLEYVTQYAQFIESFLAEVGVSISAVTHYFVGDISEIHGGKEPAAREKTRAAIRPKDFDEEDPNTAALMERQAEKNTCIAELEKCEHVAKTFFEMTEISLYEVIKLVSSEVKNASSPARVATVATPGTLGRQNSKNANGIALPYSLDSYTSLSCLLCFMHECPFHAHTSGSHDEDGSRETDDVYMHQPTKIRGWSYSSPTAVQDPWQEDEPCSKACFINDRECDQVIPGKWTEAQKVLLRSSADVLRNNPRFACLSSAIINKSCAEIWARIQAENLLPLASINAPDDGFSSLDSTTVEPSKILKRKKAPVLFLTGYPANCDRTHVHDKRDGFQPCRHPGICTSNCHCVRNRITCEKTCACPPDCPRRWRGCSCAREGRPCSNDRCQCVKAKRECDPDLCGTCGAPEVLDRVNIYNEKFVKGYCNNVWIQRDFPKRTLLGRSAVSGMGLFAGEHVKKDDHLGEYKGEVITGEEADRRGKIYDHKGISFLFNLNNNQVIDATRAGNKFRFVNHSGKRPNCQAKVLFVNGAHRISLFAKRDIAAGEELFFDYGYNNKCVKFVQKEPPEMTTPSTGTETADAPPKPAVRRNRHPAYLKGGKGSTERSAMLTKTRSTMSGVSDSVESSEDEYSPPHKRHRSHEPVVVARKLGLRKGR